MSLAPQSLLAARSYLIAELDVHPGVTRHADLDPAEVGIVGNPATHFGGYHLGWDRIRSQLGRRDYSVSESSRDAKPTDAAAALDIGLFDVTKNGRRLTLRHLSLWLVRQCKANAPDTRDIREVIYSPDGKVVRRWDRLGIRSGGDNTHLTHTHISYFRDSEKRDKTGLFRRYVDGTQETGGDPLIGLKKGDRGDEVKGLQVVLRAAGHSPGAVDGVYGASTAAAVLKLRKARGSTAKDGNQIDGWAWGQIMTTLAEHRAAVLDSGLSKALKKAIEDAVSGGLNLPQRLVIDLPDTITVPVQPADDEN